VARPAAGAGAVRASSSAFWDCDCVVYMPLRPDVEHLTLLLVAGINVATTAGFSPAAPVASRLGRPWRRPLAAERPASSAAGSTPAGPSTSPLWLPALSGGPPPADHRVVQHRPVGIRRQPGRTWLGSPGRRPRPRWNCAAGNRGVRRRRGVHGPPARPDVGRHSLRGAGWPGQLPAGGCLGDGRPSPRCRWSTPSPPWWPPDRASSPIATCRRLRRGSGPSS